MAEMSEELLTVPAVATTLQLSRWTAYRKLREGTIPGRVIVGRTVRIRAAVFREWIASGGDLRKFDGRTA